MVADVAPVEYPGNHDRIIVALLRVAVEALCSRGEAQSILEESIDEPGVVGYLMMGLARVGDTYRWRFNVEGLQAAYPALRGTKARGSSRGGGVVFCVALTQITYLQPMRRRSGEDSPPVRW